MWPGNELAGGDAWQDGRSALLQRVIVELHCCSAEYLETVRVREVFLGRILWEGKVAIFKVNGHARAQRCYAWVGVRRRQEVRFFAVLETGVVRSPLGAVKFAHVAANAKLIDEFSKPAGRAERPVDSGYRVGG